MTRLGTTPYDRLAAPVSLAETQTRKRERTERLRAAGETAGETVPLARFEAVRREAENRGRECDGLRAAVARLEGLLAQARAETDAGAAKAAADLSDCDAKLKAQARANAGLRARVARLEAEAEAVRAAAEAGAAALAAPGPAEQAALPRPTSAARPAKGATKGAAYRFPKNWRPK